MATSTVDCRTSSISPDRVCIWFDHVDHGRQRLIVGVNDHVQAVPEDVQVGVGDQNRDLDQAVGLEVQACHLAVDPYKFVSHEDPHYSHAGRRAATPTACAVRQVVRRTPIGSFAKTGRTAA